MSNVDKPSHYHSEGAMSVIDFIEKNKLGFHLGNFVKYLARAHRKGKYTEDLEKALWYFNRYVRTYPIADCRAPRVSSWVLERHGISKSLLELILLVISDPNKYETHIINSLKKEINENS